MCTDCSFAHVMNEFLVIVIGTSYLLSIVIGNLCDLLFVLIGIISNGFFVVVCHFTDGLTSSFKHRALHNAFSNTFHLVKIEFF